MKTRYYSRGSVSNVNPNVPNVSKSLTPNVP